MDACWIWTEGVNNSGYGAVTVAGKRIGVHRWSYEHFVGPIPEGKEIDHLCRVRRCVNPNHLEPVTRSTNMLRGLTTAARHAAKTHCPQGHEYSHRNSRGERCCRICMRVQLRRAQAKRAAARVGA